MSSGFTSINRMYGYRESTHNSKMNGFTLASFMCKRCKKSRTIDGRRKASSDPKSGWICAQCVEEKRAKSVLPKE